MPATESRIPINPIVKAITAAKGEGVHSIHGFVGETKDGQVTVYQDLELNTRMVLPAEDILHVETPDEDANPAAIYVNGDAKVTLQRSFKVSQLTGGPEGLGGQWVQAGPHSNCRARCNEVFTDLSDNVACHDFCNCRHRDLFDFNKCSSEFHDATGGKFKA